MSGERAELEFLRKKKRLMELEARASGVAPAQATVGPPIAEAGPDGGDLEWHQQGNPQQGTAQREPVSTGNRILRGLNAVGEGFSDSVYGLASALPEVSASVSRAVGLPAPESGYYDKGLKDAAVSTGRVVTKPLSEAVGDIGEYSATDRGLRAAGRGAGDAASFILPAAAVAKAAKTGSTLSNVGKVLKSQPTTQAVAGGTGAVVGQGTDSPTAGIAASMLTPFATSAARRLITPIRPTLSRETQRLVKEAEKIGIKLTAGQKTNSRPLQTAESSFNQMGGTAGAQRAVYDQQTTAFNRAVLEKAGIQADNAAPEVISGGFKTLGARFDDLVKQTTIYVDRKFIKDIEDVVAESTRKMGADDAKILTAWGDDAKQLAKALDDPAISNAGSRIIIEGDVYKKTASDLRTAIRGAQGDLKTNLIALMNKLDDAVARSMGKEVSRDWADVRGKYRNLLIIDKAVSGGTQATRNSGDIPFGAFTAAVRGSDKTGFGRGRGDLNTLARIGDFLADKIPNSGTAERTRMINMLRGSSLGTGGVTAGGGMAVGLDAQTSAMLGLGVAGTQAALPKMIQALMNSKAGQAYLTNTLAGGKGPTKELLAKILAAQGIPPANETMLNTLGAR
jgi:hypothetical protein